MPTDNKSIVSKSKQILTSLGYEVKTSHLHELFSKLAGDKSRNVSKAKETDYGKIFHQPKRTGSKEEYLTLQEAANNQDIEKLNEMINSGIDLSEEPGFMDCLIQDLLEYDKHQIVMMLIQAGYKPKLKFGVAWALAFKGTLEQIKTVDENKTIDLTNGNLFLELFNKSCEFNNIELVKYLSKHNSYSEVVADRGIYSSILGNAFEVFKFLTKDTKHPSSLAKYTQWAQKEDKLEFIEFLSNNN